MWINTINFPSLLEFLKLYLTTEAKMTLRGSQRADREYLRQYSYKWGTGKELKGS